MRHPFKMLPSRGAVLRCDGKFVIGGRASFVWETLVNRRAAGVPGVYEIRAAGSTTWHRVDATIEEAEAEIESWHSMFTARRLARLRKTREGRKQRGLPVG